jgi:hypothetical protein
VSIVHGAVAVVLVDRQWVDQMLLMYGDECLAMFTNSAAQPSTVGEHGMVCAMLLGGRSGSSSSRSTMTVSSRLMHRASRQ